MHIIDVFSRLSAVVILQNKKKTLKTILDKLMQIWAGGYGVPEELVFRLTEQQQQQSESFTPISIIKTLTFIIESGIMYNMLKLYLHLLLR